MPERVFLRSISPFQLVPRFPRSFHRSFLYFLLFPLISSLLPVHREGHAAVFVAGVSFPTVNLGHDRSDLIGVGFLNGRGFFAETLVLDFHVAHSFSLHGAFGSDLTTVQERPSVKEIQAVPVFRQQPL